MHTNDNTKVRADVSTGGGEITGMVWGGKEDFICGKKQLVANMTKWGRVSFWVVMHDLSFFLLSVILFILLGSIFQISKRKQIQDI